ncbi:pentatricopeptide repeat-containing protein At4g38010-like [Tasmannia lanceolata]|uniref:pentatricopeptide repeat-containing protein At4g38010-like n=1 Tax=Tasmannia lanceolata TaxID=3420 RepID=UPI00406489E3
MGLQLDVFLRNALIHVYGKCGDIESARKVFDEMPCNNEITWNTMILGILGVQENCLMKCPREMWLLGMRQLAVILSGAVWILRGLDEMPERDLLSWSGMIASYAQSKRATEAVGLFRATLLAGVRLDSVTMAGLVDEAKELVRGMPMEPNVVILGALLSAYKTRGYISAGVDVVKLLLKLAAGDGGCYVLLSNIYAAGDRWDEVVKMRKVMRDMREFQGVVPLK